MLLNMKDFERIFVKPGGERTNEEGKPRRTNKANETKVFLAIDAIGIALVSEIAKRTGLRESTVKRALFWLVNDKRINESSAGLKDGGIMQYSLRG